MALVHLMLGHRTVEHRPRKVLQNARKHRSLKRHGIDLQLEPERRRKRLSPSRINAMRPVQQIPSRTAVGLTRQSMAVSDRLVQAAAWTLASSARVTV